MPAKRSRLAKRAKIHGLDDLVSLSTCQRRLACWKQTSESGTRESVYVALDGATVRKPAAYKRAQREKATLDLWGVSASGPKSSLLKHRHRLFDSYKERHGDRLSDWDLPLAVEYEYKRQDHVEELFEWQKRGLELALGGEKEASLIYVAPTSGGKSIVADVIILRELLLTGRRGFAIFPHVAICDEKYKSWSQKFGSDHSCQPLCLKLGGFYGAASGTSWSGRFDLSICTAEKANGILNKLLLDAPLGIPFLKEESTGNTPNAQPSLVDQIKKSVSKFAALAHPIEAIGTFAIDEVHEIADPRRGHLIEILLAKLLLIRKMQEMRGQRPLQITCLSGTLANAQQVAQWLQAKFCEGLQRPQELTYLAVMNSEIYHLNNECEDWVVVSQPPPKRWHFDIVPGSMTKTMCSLCPQIEEGCKSCLIQDSDHIGMLVYQLWQSSSSHMTQSQDISNTLIFCPSRLWTENLAKALSIVLPQIVLFEASRKQVQPVAEFVDSFFNDPRRQSLIQALERIASPDDINPLFRITIPVGVAFHHGGLSLFERRLIEAEYAAGTLKVLCSTSTLAMGINLPIARIIFRSFDFANPAQFHQMAGRAGRNRQRGEVVVLYSDTMRRSTPPDKFLVKLKQLILSPLEPCQSSLRQSTLARAVLDFFVIKQVWRYGTLLDTMRTCTLAGHQRPAAEYEVEVSESTRFLVLTGCVSLMTKEGKATSDQASWLQTHIAAPLNLVSFFGLLPQDDASDEMLQIGFRQYLFVHKSLWNEYPAQAKQRMLKQMTVGTKEQSMGKLLDLQSTNMKSADVLCLSPFGRAVLESSLKLPEAIEGSTLLLKCVWQGLDLRSTLDLLCLCIPLNIFVSSTNLTGLRPPWKVMAMLLARDLSSPMAACCRRWEIQTNIVDRLAETNPRMPDVDEVYSELFTAKLSPDKLRRHRLLWNHGRFAMAIILFQLVELDDPENKVIHQYDLTTTTLNMLKRQVAIHAGCLANFAAALELSQLAGLLRYVSSLVSKKFSFDDYASGDLKAEVAADFQKLQSLSLLKGRRGVALFQAGLTDIEKIASATSDQIEAALERLEPYTTTHDDVEMWTRRSRRKALAQGILKEAEAYQETVTNLAAPIVKQVEESSSDGSSSVSDDETSDEL